MSYQIVTNLGIMRDIKTCPYFRTNLGLSNTVETQRGRVFRETDGFQHFYNTRYKTTIFGQGNIGDIMFYVDHYIKDEVLALYINNEEFVYPHDRELLQEKGINFYLGHLLKKSEEEHERRIAQQEQDEIDAEEAKKQRQDNADAEKVLVNPGNVSFEDLQEYLKQKNKDRYQ